MEEDEKRVDVVSEKPLVWRPITLPQIVLPRPRLVWREVGEGPLGEPIMPAGTTTYYLLSAEMLGLLKTFEVEEMAFIGARPFSLEDPSKKVDERHTENGRRFFIYDMVAVPPQKRTPISSDVIREENKATVYEVLDVSGRIYGGISHKHPGDWIEASDHRDKPFLATQRLSCFIVLDSAGSRASLYLKDEKVKNNIRDRYAISNLLRGDLNYDSEGGFGFSEWRFNWRTFYHRFEVGLSRVPRPAYREFKVDNVRAYELSLKDFNPQQFVPSSEFLDIF